MGKGLKEEYIKADRIVSCYATHTMNVIFCRNICDMYLYKISAKQIHISDCYIVQRMVVKSESRNYLQQIRIVEGERT